MNTVIHIEIFSWECIFYNKTRKVNLSPIYLLAYIDTIFKITKLSMNAYCPTDYNIA